MRPSFVNFHGDPFNSDAIAEYTHVQSDGYSGPHEDLIAPAAANFPMVTPTRYFLYLPFVPDQSDLAGARPFLLKDVTGGVALTRVSGAPAANQYRLSPDDSRTPNVIELNSGQAGNTIAYDFYGIGSVISAKEADGVNPVGTIIATGSATTPSGYLDCDGTSYLRSSYLELFAVIGTAFGAADGTHFNVPDLRGRFLRGQDEAAGNDPDAASRTADKTGGATGDNVGSYQADEAGPHGHFNVGVSGVGMPGTIASYMVAAVGAGGLTSSVLTQNNSGAESRPKNINVRFAIKY